MRKASITVGLLALGLATASWAGSWGDYTASFPLFPCQDGWLGCVVDGNVHNAELGKDSNGFPISALDRVGWNDLEATGVFSPFARLSVYTGELVTAPEPVEPTPVEPDPGDAVADGDDVGTAGDDAEAPVVTHDVPLHDAPVTHDQPTPDVITHDTPPVADAPRTPDKPVDEPAPVRDQPAHADPVEHASKKPDTTPPPADEKKPPNDAVAVLPDKPLPKEKKPTSIIGITKPKTPVAAGDDSCDVLTKLEPKAMLGKLTKGQVACLETRVGKEAKQTSKDKISRILMANAYASGDKRTWEKLIKRHLDEIDRSDPDLCYKYALHLSRKGPGRAKGVIRWADVALENRFNWQGNTYKSRVNSLYKLKAQAAQRLWQSASTVYNGNPSPDHKSKMEKARNQTKVMAREWLEYAKESGRDHTKALQLCVSAAGTEDYCAG